MSVIFTLFQTLGCDIVGMGCGFGNNMFIDIYVFCWGILGMFFKLTLMARNSHSANIKSKGDGDILDDHCMFTCKCV